PAAPRRRPPHQARGAPHRALLPLAGAFAPNQAGLGRRESPRRGRSIWASAPNIFVQAAMERIEMSAAELDLHVETESERIERWRVEELERAGFSADDAVELASRGYVDLHLAVELLERGCPPETATRILL